MLNLTDFQANATSHNILSRTFKMCVVIPLCGTFLCCTVVMLHIFASHRQFMETSRYILFACMLTNDILHFGTSVLVLHLVIGEIKVALIYCVPLLFILTATFQNTPLILATMSLERYIAIIYPLHQPAAWRSDRIWTIILSLWLICFIIPFIDFSIGKHDPSITALLTPVICKTRNINTSIVRRLFKAAVNVFFFVVVAVIIFFTYVRILVETRRLRQDRLSVTKALHTVLLHGFQLLLCVLAFILPIVETHVVVQGLHQRDMEFFNYFCLILFPRFLSPLIYGFRDQNLRGYIKKSFLCCSKTVNSCVTGKRKDVSAF